jgi:hypothetical protein
LAVFCARRPWCLPASLVCKLSGNFVPCVVACHLAISGLGLRLFLSFFLVSFLQYQCRRPWCLSASFFAMYANCPFLFLNFLSCVQLWHVISLDSGLCASFSFFLPSFFHNLNDVVCSKPSFLCLLGVNVCTNDPSDCMFKKWAGWGFKSGRIVTRLSLFRISIFCLYIEQEKGVEFQRVW